MAYAKLAHIEDKNKYRNLQRFIHVCRKEREEEDKVLGDEFTATTRETFLKEEEALAQEIDKIKNKEMKELRLRYITLLCDTNFSRYINHACLFKFL